MKTPSLSLIFFISWHIWPTFAPCLKTSRSHLKKSSSVTKKVSTKRRLNKKLRSRHSKSLT